MLAPRVLLDRAERGFQNASCDARRDGLADHSRRTGERGPAEHDRIAVVAAPVRIVAPSFGDEFASDDVVVRRLERERKTGELDFDVELEAGRIVVVAETRVELEDAAAVACAEERRAAGDAVEEERCRRGATSALAARRRPLRRREGD